MNKEALQFSLERYFDHAVSAGQLAVDTAQRLKSAMAETGHPIDVVAVELGLIQEEALARSLAGFLGAEFIQMPSSRVDFDSLNSVGISTCENYGLVPIEGAEPGSLYLCVSDPFDLEAQKLLAYSSGKKIQLFVSTRPAISDAIKSGVDIELNDAPVVALATGDLTASDIERLQSIAQDAPIVRLVTQVVQQAVDMGATDIHIEPMDRHIQIRLRIDGVLQLYQTVSLDLLSGLSTRIKILSRLNISERRLPQDGRMHVAVRGTPVDLRVSILPSVNGETIVLRVLDRSKVQLDLEALGFAPEARQKLEELARMPNGIVLITGPTGSGKTTTLYALLSLIRSEKLKIFTVEDPVEYPMDGVTQLQVDPGIELTFARALRSVLRQDPDIILVGEIRDKETAEIAMQAALTGHLVLSTLHTNSAIGAVTRLRDMGAEDYLISSTVKAAVGQRLLRKTCTDCASYTPKMQCNTCSGEGFKGRTVTYEIASLDAATSSAISSGADENTVAELARKNGMIDISKHANGLQKAGVTTAEEVMRVVRFDSW